jgi:hypothetical protein
VRVVTVAGALSVDAVADAADEVFVDACAASAGSLPWAIWIASPPPIAIATAAARAVIFAVSLKVEGPRRVMTGTLEALAQRSLGDG